MAIPAHLLNYLSAKQSNKAGTYRVKDINPGAVQGYISSEDFQALLPGKIGFGRRFEGKMNFGKSIIIILLIIIFSFIGCGGGASSGQDAGDGCLNAEPIKVLFLGNSYTSVNNLPSLVTQLACPLGYKIEYDSNTPGGYWFADHRYNATTISKINSDNWDFVVLQNQSQVPGFKPEHVTSASLPNAQALVDAVNANDPNTEIIYYQTWGRQNGDSQNCSYYPLVCTYEGHTEALEDGYEIYQASTGGLIAPVGSEWLTIVQDSVANRPFDSDILWSGDGSHPSLTGSYLAAAVILHQIIAAPVSSSDYTAGLDASTASYILSMADSP